MNLGNRHSQHSFAQIPSVNMARSKFDRSFAAKTTFNFDQLIPIFVDEILPGDTINLNVKSFARLAPQVVPLLDNMYLDWFFFFVPNRLVWENWEKFCGYQENPSDSTDYLVPQVYIATGVDNGSIYDQMGLPTGVGMSINALPLRAYSLIWNEWFRDQNLQNSTTVPVDDGPDAQNAYAIQDSNKKHDYFTSALKWPQKGAAVTLPLGTSAPVIRTPGSGAWKGFVQGTNTDSAAGTAKLISAAGDTYLADNANVGMALDPNGGLFADLSEATAATINQFREAIMYQSLLELDARGGTRYTEILKAHFNVISPDFRLQRPEYLSGATTMIAQHVVAQTSSTVTDSPQANLAAYSTAAEMGSKVGFSKSFVEHGYVIGICRARGDITYQQGINKMWNRSTRYDFFWPKLQELGEQEILNKEIYATGFLTDDDVFGYQERYAEYRYKPSEIRGQFRSNYAETLDVWHLAEEFGSAPALNASFIKSNTPIERSLVVPDPAYPAILMDLWFDYKHIRPIMSYGVPATLGRF